MWTWKGGSNLANQNGNFGTLNVAAATNVPSARGFSTVQNISGNIWLFGGFGNDSAGTQDNLSMVLGSAVRKPQVVKSTIRQVNMAPTRTSMGIECENRRDALCRSWPPETASSNMDPGAYKELLSKVPRTSSPPSTNSLAGGVASRSRSGRGDSFRLPPWGWPPAGCIQVGADPVSVGGGGSSGRGQLRLGDVMPFQPGAGSEVAPPEHERDHRPGGQGQLTGGGEQVRPVRCRQLSRLRRGQPSVWMAGEEPGDAAGESSAVGPPESVSEQPPGARPGGGQDEQSTQQPSGDDGGGQFPRSAAARPARTAGWRSSTPSERDGLCSVVVGVSCCHGGARPFVQDQPR